MFVCLFQRTFFHRSLPQSMYIAVCIDVLWLAAHAEHSMGVRFWLEIGDLKSRFRLEADELDVMFRKHRMVCPANIDLYCMFIAASDIGQVFFHAGFLGVGDKFFHGFTATYYGDSGFHYFDDYIAAMGAAKKFSFHIVCVLNGYLPYRFWLSHLYSNESDGAL